MKRILKICFGDARSAFDGIKEPTPIWLPALFVLVCLTFAFLILEGIAALIVLWTEIRGDESDWTGVWLQLGHLLIQTTPFILLSVVFLCLWWVLTATYYFVIARLFNIRILWRNWFGFSCWSSIPLVMVPIFLVLAFTVQTVSIPGREVDPWYIELTSACLLALPFIWCARVSALGLRSWTEDAGRGMFYWRLVAIVPYISLLLAFLMSITWLLRLI